MLVDDPNQLIAEIPAELAGLRLDRALAMMFPDHSRTTLQKWLKRGLIMLDEEIPSQRDRVAGGELVQVTVPEASPIAAEPEPIPLDVVHADTDLVVLNKPAGLVVHPGAGHAHGTLMNGLLHWDPSLAALPRAGIVHRLDKDTTGLMVVARSERARMDLIAQLAARTVRRVYLAVVTGRVISGATVIDPIGRDLSDRRRMAVRASGKEAVTHYRVAARYRAHSLLKCTIDTGRTHQIRVHLRHSGWPIVGDPVYGERLRIPGQAAPELIRSLRGFRRQALHAAELRFVHPASGRSMGFEAPLAPDMQALLLALEEDARRARA